MTVAYDLPMRVPRDLVDRLDQLAHHVGGQPELMRLVGARSRSALHRLALAKGLDVVEAWVTGGPLVGFAPPSVAAQPVRLRITRADVVLQHMLAAWRRGAGATVEEAAARVDISPALWELIERGEAIPARADQRRRLEREVGVPTDIWEDLE